MITITNQVQYLMVELGIGRIGQNSQRDTEAGTEGSILGREYL
jgi:hypothetical protein